MYELKTEAFFDSAHFLSDYHGKCENLHGHRWRLEVIIGTQNLIEDGDERDMVCDFAHFKHIVRSLAEEFDHTFLVEEGTLKKKTLKALESEGFQIKELPFRTTAENLARFFFDCLSNMGLPVIAVEVDETPNNRAVYLPTNAPEPSTPANVPEDAPVPAPVPTAPVPMAGVPAPLPGKMIPASPMQMDFAAEAQFQPLPTMDPNVFAQPQTFNPENDAQRPPFGNNA